MRVRYTGPDDARLVSLPDGDTVEVARMDFVDLDTKHARSLAEQDDWELEGVVKARRTRTRKAKPRRAVPATDVATEAAPAETEEND